MNSVAGAYSDDLPLICISGGPNVHDAYEGHLVHHTVGESDLYQQSRCFQPVVGKAFAIKHPSEAAKMIDDCIATAFKLRKPVYLEIPVNLSTYQIEEPVPINNASLRAITTSDPKTMSTCLEDISQAVESSTKPVLVAGSRLQMFGSENAFYDLSKALGCATAMMPDAKGSVNEQHHNFVGCFWGPVSSPHVAEIVDSSDLVLLAGSIINDYNTTGWTALPPKEKTIFLGTDSVKFNGIYYPNIQLTEILTALANKATPKPNSLQAFQRQVGSTMFGEKVKSHFVPSGKLSVRFITDMLQKSLSARTSLVVETGDAWFIGQLLKLPKGCKYHMQMQYGSIGWSVGALLGISLAEGRQRHVLALVGDGSFQMTAQELSTMLRNNVKVTIILLNNDGYTIEAQIHDGPYNDIQRWDYAGILDIFSEGNSNALGIKVYTNEDFAAAMHRSEKHDGVCLIEAVIDRNDCTEGLLEWGSHVAKANARCYFQEGC